MELGRRHDPWSYEHDFPDTGLSDECRETTITVMRELMERHNILYL
jgi:hypothetical protein